ncbi:helix-turn-helix domain-containing protein [Streptomyces hainanensis]|uniref:XRE family transcriptional regulator n=1 Tax=Streptomyces hainanensis TaxID=402648 RepID=A0A4R4T563_9ACTN|nr:helix-turn-helix transcriptional regulator [Streptomyces hainanensis]TDC70142.1 XRE family transcriptional regulator [Streptomyces hainanensis]
MTPCKNAKCGKPIEPNPVGRPKEYCDKRCRDAAYRAGHAVPAPNAQRFTPCLQDITRDLARRVEALGRAAEADDRSGAHALRVLELAAGLGPVVEDLEAASVQQARDRRVRAAEIARRLNVSPGRLRSRWPTDRVARRMRQRGRANGAFIVQQGADAAAGESPEATELTLALARLQRASGRNLRELGERTGVSASYLSRVLTGKRRPSWELAQALTAACGGDPAELLPLWQAARPPARSPARAPTRTSTRPPAPHTPVSAPARAGSVGPPAAAFG